MLEEDEQAGCAYRVAQQQMHALHPVLSTRFAFTFFLAMGILFTTFGGVFVHYSLDITECTHRYPTFNRDQATSCTDRDCYIDTVVTLEKEDCVGLAADGSIKGPVFLYYAMTNFFQNHRRYVMSRSTSQLTGSVVTDVSKLSACSPMITAADDRIMHPCGLIAWSVFNDTFTATDRDGTAIHLDESGEAINFNVDSTFYKNPSPEEVASNQGTVDFWMNPVVFPGQVEDPHFINWMRLAQTSSFRKLYARIDDPPPLPWTLRVKNRFPLVGKGSKAVLISTANFMGGRNIFLGTLYITTGLVCFIFAIVFCVTLRKKPRIYGDVRFMLQSESKNK